MKQKIVFLDQATVDYGDIDLQGLAALGDYHAYDRTSPEELPARIADAAIIITNKVVIDKKTMDRCPQLKCIVVAATGYTTVDIAAARKRGISVCNVPTYSTLSVAQLTFGFIIALATNLFPYAGAVRSGAWCASPLFTMTDWQTTELANKTIGIIGMGSIGRKVAALAEAFDMRVIALKRPGIYYDDFFERLDLISLARQSDIVSVHITHSPETEQMIDRAFFGAMKPSAFFINMARGSIVNSAHLAEALNAGTIAGAAIDVMEKEPPSPDDPLLAAKNIIITPHIAWASLESRLRLVDEIVQNIAAFQKGEDRNRVNS